MQAVKIIQKSTLTKAKSKQKVLLILSIVNELNKNPLLTLAPQHRKVPAPLLRQPERLHRAINLRQQSTHPHN